MHSCRDRQRGRARGLRPGETVLVLGAGGGVGLAAIQVATNSARPCWPATVPLESGGTVMEDLLNRRVTGKVALIP